MDLDGFLNMVEAFNAVFPPSKEPSAIFNEEVREFYDALETHAPKAEVDKEWADALWTLLILGLYHNVDMPKCMASVAHKNYLKIKHKHLFKQDPDTGKWIKPDRWNEMVENGEIT